MHMHRWMCGNTQRDKVRNEDICAKIGVASIGEKMMFGTEKRRSV